MREELDKLDKGLLKPLTLGDVVPDAYLATRYLMKRSDAIRRHIKFTLSLKEYKKLLESNKCFFTGEILTYENRSLDRVDNSIGYTKDNTVVCEEGLNKRKGKLSVKEIVILFNGLNKKLRQINRRKK